jgi:hypothetical protein
VKRVGLELGVRYVLEGSVRKSANRVRITGQLGHFALEHYSEAAAAARKAIHFNPGFSMSHMLLAASLAKLGRLGEAKGAAARVLELQPSYRFGKHFAGVDCAPLLAASLSEALRVAGLPE